MFFEGLIDIEFETKRKEKPWEDDISKADHTFGNFSFGVEEREDQLDRQIKVFSNSDHHISSINPKDIIEEQRPQQQQSSFGGAQIESFKSHNRKQDSKNIVKSPMFSHKVKSNRNQDNTNTDNSSNWKLELFSLKEILEEFGDIEGKNRFFDVLGEGKQLCCQSWNRHNNGKGEVTIDET